MAFDIWDSLTITFSFPDSATDYLGYDLDLLDIVTGFSSFTVMQEDAVRQILATISSFTNLVFLELTGADDANATMRFGNSDITETAFAFLPSNNTSGGDVWVSSATELASPNIGNYAYFTLIHEIGHALGLLHPHEAEASSNPMPRDRDWMAFTAMSYRSYENAELDGYTNSDNEFAQTFMVEDIAALQTMYGARYGETGETRIYTFDPDTGEMKVNGISQGIPDANVIYSTIWGGSLETYDFSNYDVPTWIDLRPGEWTRTLERQDTSYTTESFRNAYLFDGDERGLIENAIGGSSDDEILGNEGVNRLEGGLGNDGLLGFGGNDHILGGDGFDSLWGGDGDDRLEGGADEDTLHGEAGNDVLIGGHGNDGLYGGDGNDTLYGNAGGDHLDGGAGEDILYAGDQPHEFAINQLLGGDGDDKLYGGVGKDKLTGGKGNDLLVGGDGDDIYVFESGDGIDTVIELAGGGIDSIFANFSLVLADHIENGRIEGFEHLDLTGNSADNLLEGNYGNNIIDGGAGVDEMRGSSGDDTYFVDNALDVIVEGVGAGDDTIYASVSYVLEAGRTITYPSGFSQFFAGPEVENLILTGTGNIDATGNEASTNFQGNSGDNRIAPGKGADFVDGGDGVDTAVFGQNFARYTITTLANGDIEVSGPEGRNTLRNMEFAQFADELVALVPANVTIEGTPAIDYLDGTDGDDVILGLADNDFLNGFAGNDTLDGGTGDDDLRGGLGDDSYHVDGWGDTVVELSGEGFDRIYASFNISAFARRYANIESFALAGSATDLFGNDGVNELIGNPNIRSRIYGLGGADSLIGGAANDKLDGGAGSDTMAGGLGDDTYIVDNAGDVVTELAGEGTDTVRAKINYTLGANVENLQLQGVATSGTGNALDNIIRVSGLAVTLSGMDGDDKLYGSTLNDTLYGGAGNDVLQGRAGADTLYGGGGDDTLYGGGGADYLDGQGGNDTLRGSVGDDHLLGGAGNDLLYGDDNDDTLDGGSGVDRLEGGVGNDILIGGADRDVMFGGAGADTFVFDEAHFGGLLSNNADRIADFRHSQGDLIDLSLIDAIIGGGDDAFAFIDNAAFSGTAGELRWENAGGNTMVYMDVDGDGQADYAIRLDGTLNLAEADFIL